MHTLPEKCVPFGRQSNINKDIQGHTPEAQALPKKLSYRLSHAPPETGPLPCTFLQVQATEPRRAKTRYNIL